MASTSCQISSSSVCYSGPTRWDVFLSFRGPDTRFKFTSHLYAAFDRHGVRTFKDDPELRSGEVISDALVQAIKESKTYVVVFSENYASSCWCLDELVEIYECYKTMRRLVIPVFYNIDPCAVRHQTDNFNEAFEKHQIRFAGDTEKVNKWRLTLTKVAGFSGTHVSQNRSEADIINEIVDTILLQINPSTLDVAKYPVGLQFHVEIIEKLLSSGTEGVIKFGIYGMGGMGKTTLAKALYNQLLQGGFGGSCFLANVREVSGSTSGLVSLQQQLIDDIIKTKSFMKVYNVDQGTKLIAERLSSTKALVVVDDLDHYKQYESLVTRFAPGSVVIITTRDEEILDKIDVEPRYRYRVNELDEAKSLELFTRHAFGNAKPDNTLMVLSRVILRFAGGLPLALEVFGSYLYKRSEVEWHSYIDKLQRSPNSSIQQRLIISLDALDLDDPMLKKIFLDIACFFIGKDRQTIVKILETYHSYANHHIDILKKRCLLTINDKDELGMHDLLRDMGREVAHNKSHDEPGKQSRLWVSKDICDVLKKHKGTEVIEGIIPLNFSYKEALRGVSFSTDTFKMMTKLRLLYLERVNLTGSFEQIFEDLRWLHWKFCPLNCLPAEFYPQKLVILELPSSKMKTMWELNMVPHVFEKLKTLDLSNSLNLTTISDLSKLPCLEMLNLEGCRSLEEVHISIGNLVMLVVLNLHGCWNLRSLPDTICNLKSLSHLDISKCNKLGKVKRLKEPTTSGPIYTDSGHELFVAELPANLKWMKAYGCTSMKRFPNLFNLKQLEILDLTNCNNLTEIQGLQELISIRELHLEGCNSTHLAHTFTERFFQIYCGFGHLIKMYLGVADFPGWISQSCNVVDLMYIQTQFATSVCLDLPPNPPHNFLGMILCFKAGRNGSVFKITVKNTKGDVIWYKYNLFGFSTPNHSMMVVVPISVFSVRVGDSTIELAANAALLGFHLLYKKDIV